MQDTQVLVPILCYHSVGFGRIGPVARYTVTPDGFTQQMDWLVGNGFSGMTVPHYAECLMGRRPLPSRPVVITFDDGYRDFASSAFPVLQPRGLPVTLFVPTALVGRGVDAGPESGWPEMLDWSEIADLHVSGVAIGSHAHTHRQLDIMPSREARRELELSKAVLEDHIQSGVETVAYPYGYNSARTRRAAAAAGYSSACGVKNSYSHQHDDIWSMARFLIEATHTLDDFSGIVAGRSGSPAPTRERPRTFGWRQVRRGRRLLQSAPRLRPPPVDQSARDGAIAPPLRAPVAILEADLEHPLPSVEPSREPDYTSAQAVVRLHGHTLGMVTSSTEQGRLTAARLAEAIWDSMAPQILGHLPQDAVQHVKELPPTGLPARLPTDPPPPSTVELPLVSVVIATLDRARRLAACVESLLNCRYPRVEIIVVDNAPGLGGTVDVVAQEFGSRSEVSYVAEPRRGVSAARNRGAAAARGDIIAFVDDDVVVNQDYLSAVVQGFLRWPRTHCVTGLIVPAELETPAQLRMEQYGGFNKGYDMRVFDLEEHRVDDVLYPYRIGMYGSGASLAIRADAFRTLGGFDESLGAGTPTFGAEDLDILLRVINGGMRLVYQPDALVWHYHRRFDDDVARQIYRYGVALAAVFTKHALTDRRVFIDIARRLPHVALYTLHPQSAKNANRQGSDYPRRLVLLEMAGLLVGPVAFLRSHLRRQAGVAKA